VGLRRVRTLWAARLTVETQTGRAGGNPPLTIFPVPCAATLSLGIAQRRKASPLPTGWDLRLLGAKLPRHSPPVAKPLSQPTVLHPGRVSPNLACEVVPYPPRHLGCVVRASQGNEGLEERLWPLFRCALTANPPSNPLPVPDLVDLASPISQPFDGPCPPPALRFADVRSRQRPSLGTGGSEADCSAAAPRSSLQAASQARATSAPRSDRTQGR
jgi:hypothetical protein